MPTFKKSVIWAWIGFSISVLIAATIAACLVRFKQLNGHTFLLGSGDQKPVLTGLGYQESFSSIYCQGLRVADATGEAAVFNAYVLPKQPVPSGKSFRQTVKMTTMIGPARVSPPLVFNLHRSGRSVAWMEVQACSETTEIALYRCEDESAAVAWEQKGDNQRCKVHCQYPTCGAVKNSCAFVANSAFKVDVLVLMLTPLEESSDNKVSVRVNITRFPYDLSVHSATCLNMTHCELPIIMGETEAVVLEAPVGGTVNPITLETECVPRISIYFAFYLGFPLAVILAASLCVFLPCLLLHKSLKRQSFELKGRAGDCNDASIISEHDGATLMDNEYISER